MRHNIRHANFRQTAAILVAVLSCHGLIGLGLAKMDLVQITLPKTPPIQIELLTFNESETPITEPIPDLPAPTTPEPPKPITPELPKPTPPKPVVKPVVQEQIVKTKQPADFQLQEQTRLTEERRLQEEQRLKQERLAEEKRRLQEEERQTAEKAREEAQRQAKLQQERLEQEKLEQERLAREQAQRQAEQELQRQEAQRQAQARAEAEARQAAEKAKEEAQRQAKLQQAKLEQAQSQAQAAKEPINLSSSQVAASWLKKPNLSFGADEILELGEPKKRSVSANFNFDAKGNISNITIETTGSVKLDRELKKRLAKARLHPQVIDGSARAGKANFTISF